MVRPPAWAAPPGTQPPQTKTPVGARGLGLPQGLSLGSALNPQLLLGRAAQRGATPHRHPAGSPGPPALCQRSPGSREPFLGTKVHPAEGQEISSTLPTSRDPPPTTSLDGARVEATGRRRIPRPSPCHQTGIVVILFLTLLSPPFKRDGKKKRLEGERGKGAK